MGDKCWIVGNAELLYDIDGDLVFQSVFIDIHKRKETELRNVNLKRQVEAAGSFCGFPWRIQPSMISITIRRRGY